MSSTLNENSNKIIHPKGLTIKLKDHQLASIYAMNQLEQNGKVVANIKSIVHRNKAYAESSDRYRQYGYYYSYGLYDIPIAKRVYKPIEYTIESNFGILSDIVGSGKTLTTVGLIYHSLQPPNHEKIISTCTFSSLKYKDTEEALKTNLIIVPHNLVTQWKEAFAVGLKTDKPLKVFTVATHKHIDFLVYPENVFGDEIIEDTTVAKTNDDKDNPDNVLSKLNTVEYYDVILCSATMSNDYFKKFNEIKYSRIIIDEICSIKDLPQTLNFKANFVWFITATPSGISNIRRTYMKDMVNSNMHPFIFNNIIIKNEDDYVSKSMSLPNISQVLIKCFTPKELELIREFIPSDVMDMLNAGDYQEAVLRLNCNVDTNENILQVLTNKISEEIHNKKAELKYKESIIPTDRKTHDESIARIKEKISSLESKFESITTRIKEFNTQNCPICMDEFSETKPGILPCCNQLFCITCLTQIKNICPMCRIPFRMDQVLVIMDDFKKDEKLLNDGPKVKEITKIDASIKIIKDKPNSRFLLFSNYDRTFDNLIKKLDENSIKYSKVQGSGATVNRIIDRFTKGEIRVLMLNATNYGSGLNLQMATDIIIYHQLSLELETQVIGRAQRIGRIEPLNIYYLLHDNETNNVTNPILSLDLTLDTDMDEFNKHLTITQDNELSEEPVLQDVAPAPIPVVPVKAKRGRKKVVVTATATAGRRVIDL